MKETKISSPATIHKPNGYSHVAEVTKGKLVYIAGQVAFNQAGEIVGKEDFGAQAEQVFKNLDAALKAAGANFHDVIKMNIFVDARVDRAKLPALRSVRDKFVNTAAPPVSTLVFVAGLVNPDWLVEIEAVAVAG